MPEELKHLVSQSMFWTVSFCVFWCAGWSHWGLQNYERTWGYRVQGILSSTGL